MPGSSCLSVFTSSEVLCISGLCLPASSDQLLEEPRPTSGGLGLHLSSKVRKEPKSLQIQ